MKQHGFNPILECPLFAEFITDFAELEYVTLPSTHTVLLIAADAFGVRADIIARVAERLLSLGLIYVCVWGPDCERVHDLFDEVHMGDGSMEPTFVFMSTWHSKDTLEEAIWFFLSCAFSFDTEIETTAYLAVSVSNTEWAAAVDHALSDIPALKNRMLSNEAESTGNA